MLIDCQHGPFPRPSNSTSEAEPKLQSSLAGAATCVSNESGRDQHILLERIEAERDESQAKDEHRSPDVCFPSSHVVGDGKSKRLRNVKEQQEDHDGGLMESTGDSTSVWSSVDQDMNYCHSEKGESCANVYLVFIWGFFQFKLGN